jgi:hypothetical protein
VSQKPRELEIWKTGCLIKAESIRVSKHFFTTMTLACKGRDRKRSTPAFLFSYLPWCFPLTNPTIIKEHWRPQGTTCSSEILTTRTRAKKHRYWIGLEEVTKTRDQPAKRKYVYQGVKDYYWDPIRRKEPITQICSAGEKTSLLPTGIRLSKYYSPGLCLC